ncbi:MAG: hypothetical protein HYY00_07755 [Chloroflexi bacterium]|nr:hypothetical protein [Chloroflexota bacterium]
MIFVECKPDAALVRRLIGLPRREVVHEIKGKPEVCKRLSASENCTALVDEDPRSVQPKYMQNIRSWQTPAGMGIRFHDSSQHNRLVLLCPKLEDWVLQAAGDVRLHLANYSLPRDAEALHSVINVDIEKFERLLEDLLEANCERLRLLERVLRRVRMRETNA